MIGLLKLVPLVLAATVTAQYNVQPFKIQIPTDDVSHLTSFAQFTRLPSGHEFYGSNASHGIPRDELKSLKDKWLGEFDWEQQQAQLNQFHHYTVNIENTTLHFIHEKSKDPNAIPILMAHGWPGSFLEYLPTVPLLTPVQKGKSGQNVSYNVVIPDLPGFGFSPLPSATWNIEDTTRIYNKLMTEVLGYRRYTVFGSDWGSSPTYQLYTSYQENVKAAHFAFIPFLPPSAAEIAAENITLTPFEQEGFTRIQTWFVSGNAYYNEHTYRPNTIGLALLDNPVGQLAWIGEKFLEWSDPDRSAPSTFTDNTILTSVSLYYLTRTFLSSVWIYSRTSLSSDYNVTRPSAPMGFSAFRFNPGQWPEKFIAKTGNLTVYNEHLRGGHFPGIDNPTALVADIRELAEYWAQ